MQVVLGADAVVAQGDEAGGHGASGASLMTLLPELVDRVAADAAGRAGAQRPVPVLAAGEWGHAALMLHAHVEQVFRWVYLQTQRTQHTLAGASAPP